MQFWNIISDQLSYLLYFFNFLFLCICRRIIMLETVAGVPGMVAAMTRHLYSLRRMSRDHGWIHTLLGKTGQT